MKFKIRNYLIVFISCSTLFASCFTALAISSDSDVSLEVDDPCNYNDTCDVYETEANCSSDCGCDNDGICEAGRGETASNCQKDCGGGVVAITDVTPPDIFNLLVVPAQQSARINWQTDELTFLTFRWGETQSIQEETISKIGYATDYSVLIDELAPDTVYYFEIQLRDKNHNKTITELQSFKTLGLPDDISPANVEDLKASEGEEEIELSWKNPPDPDFKEVRIVRNNQFYPQGPNDGEVVYQGSKDGFIDKDVFDEDYYYTIFAYDGSGNYSSGAIIKAKPTKAPQAPPRPPVILPTDPPAVPLEIEGLTLEDISFTQDGKVIEVKEGSILADTGKPMKISIKYDKLPEVLKTIVINLEKCDYGKKLNPNSPSSIPESQLSLNSSSSIRNSHSSVKDLQFKIQNSESSKADSCSIFSFLLKVDPQKIEYSATIISPYEAGIYPIAVSILDFQHQELKELTGKLLLRETIVPIQDQIINIWAIIGRIIVFGGGLGLIFLIARTIYRFFTKRKKTLSPSSL